MTAPSRVRDAIAGAMSQVAAPPKPMPAPRPASTRCLRRTGSEQDEPDDDLHGPGEVPSQPPQERQAGDPAVTDRVLLDERPEEQRRADGKCRVR